MAYRIESHNYRFFVIAPVHGVVFSADTRRECEEFIGRDRTPNPMADYCARFVAEYVRQGGDTNELRFGTIRDAFDAHYFVEDAVANHLAEREAVASRLDL